MKDAPFHDPGTLSSAKFQQKKARIKIHHTQQLSRQTASHIGRATGTGTGDELGVVRLTS
jgi:hypothetical protein